MVKIEIKGLKELQAKLTKDSQKLKTETNAILEAGAQKWVRDAKRDAPVDLGKLRNSISYYPQGPLSFSIVSGAEYSAYLEWGTIEKVNVPGELANYAIQFKGRGIRKNGGILPHPYFFKQTAPVKIQVEKMIKAMVDDL